MNDKHDDIDLFEDYAGDHLSASDRDAFEERLASDEDFAMQFKNYQLSVQLIEREGLKEEMAHIMDAEKKSVRSNYWYYGFAASILILLGVAYLFYPSGRQDLYSQYFEPYPNVLAMRSESQTTTGLEAYSDQEWSKAGELLNGIEPKSDTIAFYLSMVYLNQGNYEAAIPFLNTMDSSSLFFQQKQWYLALAYLKVQKIDSSTRYLKRIQPQAFKYSEAQKLLKALN